MSEDLTRAQQILMWELFAAGGERLNKDILPVPDKKDRETLVRMGLIEAIEEGRTLRLRLKDDRGWRWIADGDPFPIGETEKRVTAERRLLQSLVRGFKRYAADQKSTIQQLFLASRKTKPTHKPSDAPILADGHADLEGQVVEAFKTLAGNPARDSIGLTKLRAHLSHVDRRQLDEALRRMRSSKRANLIALDNPLDIEAEREAAIKIKDDVFHKLWIDL